MSIIKLSDSELLSKTRDLARREQALALELIEHLLEVDARKLYATLKYDSLFKYIVRELGYSEAIAYERLRAMRLVRRVPEARAKLESGALSLTTAAQVESFRKQEELTQSETLALMEEASRKSKREVERLLLIKAPDAIPREKIRQVTETLQEAKLILDPELQALLGRYEELHGKKPLSEILARLLESHLEKVDPLRKTMPTSKRSVKPPTPGTRYVRVQDRSLLWKRSEGRCEWRDPKTGGRCTSRYRLQQDHYPIPFAKGGPSTFENLRLVCPAHNARFAVEVYGRSFYREPSS